MLKHCFALTKVLIKSLFDTKFGGQTKKYKKRNSKASTIALFAVLGLLVIVPLFAYGYAVGSVIASVDTSVFKIIWNTLLPSAMIIIFLLSILSIVSVFFYSMDNAVLLPLPLKSWEILIARFITSLIFVYFTELLFVAPMIFGLGLGFELSIIQGLTLLLVLIALPVFPVSLCAIIFTFLSRIINFSKYKSAFTYISMFIAIAISLLINVGARSAGSSLENIENLESIIDAIKTMDTGLINYVPFLIPASSALSSPDILTKLLNIVLLLIINFAFIAIFALLCQKPYYKTLRESGNNGGKKTKITKEEITTQTKSTPIFKSLVVNEWKTLQRSPAFFSNTVLAIVLVPIIMIGSFAIAFEVEGGKEGFGFAALIQDLQNLSIGNSFALLGVVCIILFLCSMNMTSSSAISRMGKSAEFIKTIPVRPSTILYSKIFIGTMLSNLVSLLFLVLLIFLGITNIFDAVLLFILICSLNLLDNHIGIVFDLRKPFLNWANETAAVKNNLNTLWGMLLSYGVIAIIAVLCIIFSAVQFGGYIAYAILLLGSVVGNLVFHKHYQKKAKELFKAI